MHHELDSNGNFEERSLWVHKVSVDHADQAGPDVSYNTATWLMRFLAVPLGSFSDVPLLSAGHGCVDVPTSSDLASARYAVAGFRSPLHN